MKLKWLINTTAITLLILVGFLGLAGHDSVVAAQDESTKIEGLLLDNFAAEGSADFIVRFTDQADLSSAYSMDWDARGEFVYNTLRETAANSQVNAIAILEGKGMRYQTFIAGNDLYVYSGTLADATELAALPEVYFIRATRTYSIEPLPETTSLAKISWAGDLLANYALTSVGESPEALAWGISYTKADQFWAAYGVRGDGMVVANIDTGVQWNHPALDQAFKCGSNPSDPACWADPSNICGGSACDNNGHGTHTMGTMVGDDDPALTWQAGMAPNAQWIACKGCETNSCSDAALNGCADWLLAPGGSAANRPDVVNNSWGGGGGDTWYQAKVVAWRAAGIFPAFSAGNSGSGCNTLGSPGDYQESFGSAAHDSGGNIASFSSRGPSAFGHDPYTKPNIAAPGVSVCSSVPTNGWSCGYSGTSMASPHSAGAVALLWSCNPALVGQMDLTFQALQNAATTPPAGNCGAPPDGQGNYTFGYGYLDVLAAGTTVCGGVSTGHLDGHVYDPNDNPIEGANVSAVPALEGNAINAITDPNGYYTMTLVVGTYDVTASKENYSSQTVTGVQILENQTTTQDFQLSYLGGWELGPSMCFDLTRIDAEYFPATGLVYIMGGRGGPTGGDTIANIYSFNPQTGQCLDTGADMPYPISNYTINLVNDGTDDLLCTFGGRGAAGTSILNVQCYNPMTNVATSVTNLPAAYTGFTSGAQVVVDNMVYVFGGFNSAAPPYELARTDRYDPVANTFTQIGDLSLARSYINAAVVDGKIYAFGGTVFDGANLNAQTRTEVMADPAGAGTWDNASVAELTTATAEGRAYGFDTNSGYELSGLIVIAGGGQWPGETNAVFTYDTATDTYDEAFPDLINARRDHAGAFVPGDPGAMWVFGGRQGVDTPPYMPAEFYLVNVSQLAPSIVVDPMELSSPMMLPGDTATLPMTITNMGNADLLWDLFHGTFNGWEDNFDSYPTGASLHGLGGWKGWFNDPAATAYTSDAQARTNPNSVAIQGPTDLVHEYTGFTDGMWTYSAWQFIPSSFSGTTYFILLNQYDDAGSNLNWSTEVQFNSNTGTLINDGDAGGELPIIYDQWVKIRVDIDLDADTQDFYYGGDLLFSGSWSEGMSGGGITTIQAVDLYANGASAVYYDDISLGAWEDTPWFSVDPTSGTTLPGEDSFVDATFDATGMDVGVHTTTLWVESNDPMNPWLSIPVTMTVESVDLTIDKTDTPDPVYVGEQLTYNLTATNNGLQTATGVTVVDTLPAGVTDIAFSPICSLVDLVVTCDVGSLEVGASAEITITVTAPMEVGTLTNTATVEGNELDPDTENNSVSITTQVSIKPIEDFFSYLPIIVK